MLIIDIDCKTIQLFIFHIKAVDSIFISLFKWCVHEGVFLISEVVSDKKRKLYSRKTRHFSLCQPRDSGIKIKHIIYDLRVLDIEHKITFNYKVNKIMCLGLELEL